MTTTYAPLVAEIASTNTRMPVTDRLATDSDFKYFYNDMSARDFYAGVAAGTLTLHGSHSISAGA